MTIDPFSVRQFLPADREMVFALADRLMIGVAPWRDAGAVRAAVRGWVSRSLEEQGDEGAVLIAEGNYGAVIGFVSVERGKHWSGQGQAHVGELVVAEEVEGHGVGRALMAAAENWASEHGYEMLVLETGAANARARAFYARLGYGEEDVRLTKLLGSGR